MLPRLSVVVISPTFRVGTGEVVMIVEPWALVVVRTTPGKREDVVIVFPLELVVVYTASTLTDAEASKAEVVDTTMLPCALVLVMKTGRTTPLASETEAAVEEAERVPEEMTAPVLVVTLPAEFVLVAVVESGTESAEETVTLESTVLP